jgi:hypothetical protein
MHFLSLLDMKMLAVLDLMKKMEAKKQNKKSDLVMYFS